MAKLRVNKFKYSIPNFGNYTYKIDWIKKVIIIFNLRIFRTQ
jgi:hypothetical protein